MPWLIGHAISVTTEIWTNCCIPSLTHGEVEKSFTSYSFESTFLAELIMDFSINVFECCRMFLKKNHAVLLCSFTVPARALVLGM